MALRFDYSQSSHFTSVVLPEQKAIVPSHVPHFPKPMFICATLSLIAGPLIAYAALYLEWFSNSFEMILMMLYITTPAVIVGTTLGAWVTGSWTNWWAYVEKWKPGKDELAEADANDDVEKALEIVNEKEVDGPEHKEQAQ